MIRRLRAPSVRIARRRPRRTPTPAETPAPTETPAAVVDDGHRTPSYMYKLNESKRLKLLLNKHGHRQRIWAHNNKRDGIAFASANQVSVPDLIIDATLIDDVMWEQLPDRFVIKPLDGANNRGVFLLERVGADTFVDLIDGRIKTVAEIRGRYRELTEENRVSAVLTVEELLRPRPALRHRIDVPDDFKMYCFYDRVAVVMQRRMCASANRADWRFKFWSTDWNDLGPVKYPDRCDEGLERPEGADDLVSVAEQLGRQLAVAFVRIDLFDTDRGVVFGEVTPHPGPPEVWTPEFDEQLGHAWEGAEARLLAEGVAPNERRPQAAN